MQSSTTTRGSCGLCGSSELRDLPLPKQTVGGALGALSGVGLKRCATCGFELVEPRPSDGMLAAFYEAQDYTAHEPVDDAAAQRRAKGQLRLIEEAGGTLEGASVLDVGCGGGQFLAAARAKGAKVSGVDPAAHAHAACRQQGIHVVSQLADLGSQRFDGIVMSHVLEHVPDVLATLAELHQRLRAEGWLCLEVPNRDSLRARLSPQAVTKLGADERHRAFPIHLSYFTPATLERALAAAGFAVEAATTSGLGVEALWPRWAKRADKPSRSGGRGEASAEKVKEAREARRGGARVAAAAAMEVSADGEAKLGVRRGALSAAKTAAKAVAKRRYFGALLGENLVVVARPVS